jgi:sugar O-acyltransferase (sialic acid O-acetyltransferase NeuD family)
MSEAQLFGIYGASGFGREVLPVLRNMLNTNVDARIVFIDDGAKERHLNGCDVLTFDAFVSEKGVKRVNCAIADGATRRVLVHKCESAGLSFFAIRAPDSVVMDHVNMGEGGIVQPYVTITSNIRIGRHFHANIYSYVAHDCVIGDFVTFAPRVSCNGNIVIEDDVYVGTGAIIRQGRPGRPIVIGRGSVIGMGAVVTKDVPPGVTVIGNPARPM